MARVNVMRRVYVILTLALCAFAAPLAGEPVAAVTADGRTLLINDDGTWVEASEPVPMDNKRYFTLPPATNQEPPSAAKSGGTSGVKIELPNCINATARAVQLIDRNNTFDLVFVLVNNETTRFMVFDPMKTRQARQSLFANTRSGIDVVDNLGNNYDWQASDFAEGQLTKVKILPASEATILFPVDESLMQQADKISLNLSGMVMNGRDLQCQQIVLEFDSAIWTFAGG